MGDFLLGSGHNPGSGLVTSFGAFEIFDVKNITMIARIRASENGGCRQHRKVLGLQAGRDPQGFLRPVRRNLSIVRITIAAGGERIKEIQLYYCD